MHFAPKAAMGPRRHEASLSRRSLMIWTAACAVAGAAAPGARGATMVSGSASDVTIESFSAAGKSLGLVRVAKVLRSDFEWLQRLTPEEFAVTRRDKTEKAYSGQYWDSHEDGLYLCIGCDTALFDSSSKFASHTGWPSFTEPISFYNIVKSDDRSEGMRRVAVACARCDAHVGHVFQDGPPPFGMRYCIDSVALRFVPRTPDTSAQRS